MQLHTSCNNSLIPWFKVNVNRDDNGHCLLSLAIFIPIFIQENIKKKND